MGTINVLFRVYFFLFLFISLSLSRTYQMRSFLKKQKRGSETLSKSYYDVFSPHSGRVFCTELYSCPTVSYFDPNPNRIFDNLCRHIMFSYPPLIISTFPFISSYLLCSLNPMSLCLPFITPISQLYLLQ